MSSGLTRGSTHNSPRVLSRKTQRVQSAAPHALTRLSTVIGSTDACSFCAGRPRPGWGGGTASSGGSVQIRLGAMDIGDKHLLPVVLRPQKRGPLGSGPWASLAMPAINADPIEIASPEPAPDA